MRNVLNSRLLPACSVCMYVWSQFFTILNHTPKSDGHVRTTPRRTHASSIDRADVELKQLQYETRRAAPRPGHRADVGRDANVPQHGTCHIYADHTLTNSPLARDVKSSANRPWVLNACGSADIP